MQPHSHARTPRYFLWAVLISTACGGGTGSSPSAPSTTSSTYSASPTVAFSATDLTVTTGAQASNGDILTVTYFGWLYDQAALENKGLLFDAASEGASFTVVLGAGQVISGWDQGLVGMRRGAKRRFYGGGRG